MLQVLIVQLAILSSLSSLREQAAVHQGDLCSCSLPVLRGALALYVHLLAGKISICCPRAEGKLAALGTRQAELPALLLRRSSFLG